VGETVIPLELEAQALPATNDDSVQPRKRAVFMLGISAQTPPTFTHVSRRGPPGLFEIRQSRHPPPHDMLKPDVLPIA